jgi:hypothetical protein
MHPESAPRKIDTLAGVAGAFASKLPRHGLCSTGDQALFIKESAEETSGS